MQPTVAVTVYIPAQSVVAVLPDCPLLHEYTALLIELPQIDIDAVAVPVHEQPALVFAFAMTGVILETLKDETKLLPQV